MSTAQPSRIGIRLLDNLGSARELIELAVAAEEAGFDAVWMPTDILRLNPHPLMGAVAARTSRISLGLGNNPYTTDPSVIATLIATVDELSGGRVVANIGMHTTDMFNWVGINARDYLQRTREAVEIIRLLLDGEIARYEGKEFRWPAEAFLRMRRPDRRVPLYVTPFGRDFMALSGQIGDGSVPMITPPESAAEVVAAVHGGAQQAGRPVEDVDIIGFSWISISEDGTLAREVLADVVGYFGWFLDEFALNTIGLSKDDFAPIQKALQARNPRAARDLVRPEMLRLAISGTPDECIKVVDGILDAGVSMVCVGGPLGPDPRTAIRLMGQTLVPHVHSR